MRGFWCLAEGSSERRNSLETARRAFHPRHEARPGGGVPLGEVRDREVELAACRRSEADLHRCVR